MGPHHENEVQTVSEDAGMSLLGTVLDLKALFIIKKQDSTA